MFPLAPLTPRERQVGRLRGECLEAKQIARKIGCSPRTVEVHLSHIREKLGLKNSLEIVRLACTTMIFKEADEQPLAVMGLTGPELATFAAEGH